MIDKIQDEDLARADLRRQERLEGERQPWETTYQEIDERFPQGAGGFLKQTKGQIRGGRNYDSTHITALGRFRAAMKSITTPRQTEYIRPEFLDENLMKLRPVQLWCAYAGRRLQAMRHAALTGFGISADEDWDQLGRYGTSAVWQDVRPDGRGMMYRTLHLSTTWIEVDFSGLVNTVHRKYEASVRELAEHFGAEALTPKMMAVLEDADPNKADTTKFQILHVVTPNTAFDKDRWDHRRFPVASRFLAMDEKIFLRRKGYYTMPITVSRNMTSPAEIYGRSPSTSTMPNIQGANTMKHTSLRAGHKAVDPALMFNDDDGATSLATKPAGLNPGLVDDMGRPKVLPMPGGERGIPYALEMIQDERSTIKTAFLEEFYSILTNPNSRMTTVEVYERMAKEGVLVHPYAERYETEKQHPVSQRDLDLALRHGQIKPFPPEVLEAGAWPVIYYENPLAAMARAESTGRTMRYVEAATPFMNADPELMDWFDMDALMPGMAAEIGVEPRYIRDPKEVKAMRQQRKADAANTVTADDALKMSGAAVNQAKANQIARSA